MFNYIILFNLKNSFLSDIAFSISSNSLVSINCLCSISLIFIEIVES